MYVYLNLSIYIYIYPSICISINLYIYMYIYTCIHNSRTPLPPPGDAAPFRGASIGHPFCRGDCRRGAYHPCLARRHGRYGAGGRGGARESARGAGTVLTLELTNLITY